MNSADTSEYAELMTIETALQSFRTSEIATNLKYFLAWWLNKMNHFD